MKVPKWLAWARFRRRVADSSSCPECGAKLPSTTCQVCGYDIVRRTRDSINPQHPA